jgi:hypothetical protein
VVAFLWRAAVEPITLIDCATIQGDAVCRALCVGQIPTITVVTSSFLLAILYFSTPIGAVATLMLLACALWFLSSSIRDHLRLRPQFKRSKTMRSP